MNPKRKAEAVSSGSKTDLRANQIQVFSVFDSTTNLEHIASIIPRVFRDRRTACKFDWKRRKPGRIKSL